MFRLDVLFRHNPNPAQHVLSEDTDRIRFGEQIEWSAVRGEWFCFNDSDDDRVALNMADVMSYVIIGL